MSGKYLPRVPGARLARFVLGRYRATMRLRSFSPGFIPPCLPTGAPKPPSGAPKDGARVRLYSRSGNDLTARFPLIVEAIARLRSRSWIIDGEVVVCDDSGIAQFNRIRYRSYDSTVITYGDGGTAFRVSNIEQTRQHLTAYL